MFLALLTMLSSAGVPEIVAKNGGLHFDGEPMFVSGYYNSAHLQASSNWTRSFDVEISEGFNSIFVYRGLPGERSGRWGNESWADTLAFLDRCAAIGMRVGFDFSQNAMLVDPELDGPNAPPPQYSVIVDAVQRLRDHPAVFTWYLTDEPDGRGYPAAYVAKAAALIRQHDSGHRPISMCFNTLDPKQHPSRAGAWKAYVNATDLLMADIYPVHDTELACTAANHCSNLTAQIGDHVRNAVALTGKPVVFIVQGIGNQEMYQREPSAGEMRVMTYEALLGGAAGVAFAEREWEPEATPRVVASYLHVGSAQPRSTLMWNECRRLALEMNEMSPWLLSGVRAPRAASDVAGVDVRTFADAEGAMLLLVVNTLGEPTRFEVTMEDDGGAAGGGALSARALFGTAYRTVPLTRTGRGDSAAGLGTELRLADMIDGVSSRTYLIESTRVPAPLPAVAVDPHATNLIFNGGFEMATNVGSPDGFWANWGGDGGATASHEASVLRPGGGRHSYRLTTPEAGKGLRVYSYPVKAQMMVGQEYNLSLWARGGGADQVMHVGFEALFGEANVTCPISKEKGQCSYTPRSLQLPERAWKRFEFRAGCRFEPDKTGWYGMAGMVSIELASAGTAWVDDVSLALSSASA